MPDHDCAYTFGDSALPRIVLTHPPYAAPLTRGDRFRMHAMDALPGIPPEISLDGPRIFCTFEDFSQSDRTDPELRLGVVPQPSECWPLSIICHLIEEIDEERGVQQAVLHDLRDTRNRSSPFRLTASASTSAPVTKGSSRISMRT